MPNFKMKALTLALMAAMGAAQAQEKKTDDKGIGVKENIEVTGEGDKLGTGLITDEDAPKAKSSVTRAQIDKVRSSSNPFQLLQLLPGVNSNSNDATGLFGGGMRVRGFNSDQMGFTINGAPVNDSGSFSVFPQEYNDSENLCELFVTQGATDTEAPHVGASGGNVGLAVCPPAKERRLKLAISGGQLDYQRYFVRGDTGRIGNFSSFVSYSHSTVDKFRGPGGANREHVDGVVEYLLPGGSRLWGSILYNHSVTNNYRSLNFAQLAQVGYFGDFTDIVPQHLAPVRGTTQNEASIASGTAFYKYALNPFRNYIATAKANLQLTPAMRLDIEPYYWYGYGTGGVQQTSLAESVAAGTRLHTGISDINGDGDNQDTVLVYRGSLTVTHRPGITTKLNYTTPTQRILGGVWFERANHRQTQPAVRVDNNGNVDDIWLGSQQITYNDGTFYQGRNWLTISTGKSVFAQDTIDMLAGRLQVTPAISWRSIERDFNNYANSGFNAGADYHIDKTFSETLPSLNTSYQVTDTLQAFLGITKNFKVPGNFDFANLAVTAAPVNGVSAITSMLPLSVKPEKSTTVDTGLRFRQPWGKLSGTLFVTKFKDRIASAYDPVEALTHDYNVGDSTIKGVEFEAGTTPWHNFSGYASYTYTNSKIEKDMPASATTFNPTGGKQFPDTPLHMAAVSLQWASGPYLANIAAKYTGYRYLTLVNDVKVGGYTLVDLNLAYRIPAGPDSVFKNPTIRFNVSNLGDKRYLSANSGSGSLIAIAAANNPSVYPGAPRFASATFQVEF